MSIFPSLGKSKERTLLANREPEGLNAMLSLLATPLPPFSSLIQDQWPQTWLTKTLEWPQLQSCQQCYHFNNKSMATHTNIWDSCTIIYDSVLLSILPLTCLNSVADQQWCLQTLPYHIFDMFTKLALSVNLCSCLRQCWQLWTCDLVVWALLHLILYHLLSSPLQCMSQLPCNHSLQNFSYAADICRSQYSRKLELQQSRTMNLPMISKDLLPKLTFTLQRAVTLVQEKGASSWHTTLPIQEHGFPCTKLPFVVPLLWGMAECPSTHQMK